MKLLLIICFSCLPFCTNSALRAQAAGEDETLRNSHGALASIDGVLFSDRELGIDTDMRLLRVETEKYNLLRTIAAAKIRENVIEREARSKRLTTSDLLHAEIDSKVVEPSIPEIDTWISSHRETSETISKDLAQQLARERIIKQRRSARDREFVASLTVKFNVTYMFPAPRVVIKETGHFDFGSPGAPVTIVIFSDFQCPFCAKVSPRLNALRAQHPDQIRLVFKNFPLSVHKDAYSAALSGFCAAEQNAFWKFHDRLFSNQSDLSSPVLKKYASDLGLDMKQFTLCLESERAGTAIRIDSTEAADLGLTGTPSFLVNGRLQLQPQSLEDLVADELNKSSGH